MSTFKDMTTAKLQKLCDHNEEHPFPVWFPRTNNCHSSGPIHVTRAMEEDDGYLSAGEMKIYSVPIRGGQTFEFEHMAKTDGVKVLFKMDDCPSEDDYDKVDLDKKSATF